MRTLVVAPHPDDELLGCGGTLLRRVSEGGSVGWLLMTAITEEVGWPRETIEKRIAEIEQVRQGLGIHPTHFYGLGFPATQLDQFPLATLVSRISDVFKDFQPQEVLLPYPGDVHSDHRITFDAASACTKWFRYPSVRRVLAYETPSETDFGIDPTKPEFKPNVFIDISNFFEQKLELIQIYRSEMGTFPHPRSEQLLTALGQMRGAQAGFSAAESFVLLRDRHFG
jgi:N-acetylglucosamine malate deacetylase 1